MTAVTATLSRPQRRSTRLCAVCLGYGYRITARWDWRWNCQRDERRVPCAVCGGTGRELKRTEQRV